MGEKNGNQYKLKKAIAMFKGPQCPSVPAEYPPPPGISIALLVHCLATWVSTEWW